MLEDLVMGFGLGIDEEVIGERKRWHRREFFPCAFRKNV